MSVSKNIRILVATGLYPPDIGGPATYSRMLEEKLHQHGVDVVIISFGKVRHLPKVFRHLAFFGLLLNEVWRADIVYALDPISVGVPARLVAFLAHKPFIIRLGGDYAWEQGQQRFGVTQTLDQYTHEPKKLVWQVRLLAYIQTRVVKSAKYIILPSEYLKSIVQTWGVAEHTLRVLYSALFPLQVGDSKETIREQLAYTGTVLVSVARLVPWKGFEALIEAVSLLQKDIPDIMLVIIGDGPSHDSLVLKIKEHDLQEKVRLVGRLGKDALGAAIKGADIFVLNTAYEGLSHQLLEVMDIGVPIITTNIGGNGELITDGMSGILVAVGDTEGLSKAILHMALNENTRVRLTQNARLRTLEFSQEVVVEKLATFLYEEVLHKKIL